MQSFFSSVIARRILLGIAVLIVFFGAFWLGVEVGERKAQHAFRGSEQYGRMFGNPRGSGRTPFGAPMLPPSHGVFGKVISVSGNSVVVQGPDGLEQNVLVTTSTQIRVGRDQVKIDDIKLNSDIGVFGVPNEQGQIDARLIRVLKNP